MSNPLVVDALYFLSTPEGYVAAEEVLKALGTFYPPLAADAIALEVAAPIMQRLAGLAHDVLASGLADGSLIPDGRGGIIPAHGQSIYDPVTGEFTGEKT